MAEQGRSTNGPKSLPVLFSELKELIVAYFKQETVEPLKDLGRYIGYGVAGSVALGLGFSLLLLGALRALQTQTGSTFTGNLSWIPYLIVTMAAGAIAGGAVWARGRSTKPKA